MGAADLEALAVVSPAEETALAGSTAAVDAFNWLFRTMTAAVRETDPTVYTTDDGTAVPNLVGLLDGLPRFFERGLFPVFVFDGAPDPLKQETLAARRAQRRAAEAKAESASDPEEAADHRARALRMTTPIRDTTEQLLALLDLPTLGAPAEADALVAHLARHDAVEYAVTDDFDALVYGAPHTLREFTGEWPPQCMDLAATLRRHGITREQLVDVAILCGTDYNEGLAGFGPERALAAVERHGDLPAVLAAHGETIPHAERIRDLFLDPPVTDDYGFERTCDPDLSAARAFVVEEWGVPESAVAAGFERLATHRARWV